MTTNHHGKNQFAEGDAVRTPRGIGRVEDVYHILGTIDGKTGPVERVIVRHNDGESDRFDAVDVTLIRRI